MEFIGASMDLADDDEGQAHLWFTSSNISSDTLEVHSAILSKENEFEARELIYETENDAKEDILYVSSNGK